MPWAISLTPAQSWSPKMLVFFLHNFFYGNVIFLILPSLVLGSTKYKSTTSTFDVSLICLANCTGGDLQEALFTAHIKLSYTYKTAMTWLIPWTAWSPHRDKSRYPPSQRQPNPWEPSALCCLGRKDLHPPSCRLVLYWARPWGSNYHF